MDNVFRYPNEFTFRAIFIYFILCVFVYLSVCLPMSVWELEKVREVLDTLEPLGLEMVVSDHVSAGN